MSTEKAQRKGSAVKKRFYATKTRFCVSLQVVLGAAAADGQLFELLAPPAKTHDLPMSPSKIIAEGQIGSPDSWQSMGLLTRGWCRCHSGARQRSSRSCAQHMGRASSTSVPRSKAVKGSEVQRKAVSQSVPLLGMKGCAVEQTPRGGRMQNGSIAVPHSRIPVNFKCQQQKSSYTRAAQNDECGRALPHILLLCPQPVPAPSWSKNSSEAVLRAPPHK